MDDWDEAHLTDDTTPAEDTAAATEDEDGGQEPEPAHSSVEEWVTEWFAPIMRRQMTTAQCWCPEWWRHPEVIVRLEALWGAWETLRLDSGTGMSVWLRDHLDPHWAFLTDRERSPMSDCTVVDGHVREHAELPIEPAPAGWWGG